MDMKHSQLNHQYKRLTTALENIWFFDKKVKRYKPLYVKTLQEKLTTTPKMHFGNKHLIHYTVENTDNTISILNQFTFGFWVILH